VKIAAGATVIALAVSGHWMTVAGLAIGWFASKPATRATAIGAAAVGMIDDRLRAGIPCPLNDPMQPSSESLG
jgi:hypothetical protein